MDEILWKREAALEDYWGRESCWSELPLHFFGRAVESVLMAKVYIVFICAKQR